MISSSTQANPAYEALSVLVALPRRSRCQQQKVIDQYAYAAKVLVQYFQNGRQVVHLRAPSVQATPL